MSLPRCAILDDYQGLALEMADWSALEGRVEVEVVRDHVADRDALAERLMPFQIVVAMRERTPFDAALLARLPELGLLVSTGMRNAAIDMAAARSHGVVVSGTPTVGGGAAELAWGLILSLLRHIPEENALVHGGGAWQTTLGGALAGRTLGVLGYGKLGAKMAKIARAFDMEVACWSRSLTLRRAEAEGLVFCASVDDLIARADVLTIHVTLAPETRGLIGAERLAAMKPGAILVNTSRGPIVDEAALIEALRDGRLAGAGLDVYDIEPLPPEHPLRGLPNTVLTPHLGYVVEENYRAYFRGAVEAISAWLDGAPIRRLDEA